MTAERVGAVTDDRLALEALYASLPSPIWLPAADIAIYMPVTPELLRQWACRDRKDGGQRVVKDHRGLYDLRSVARTLLERQS